MEKYAQKIAEFLQKPHVSHILLNIQFSSISKQPETYTSHAFRRTGATLLADSGSSLTEVKQYGGWKSDSSAQRYIMHTKKSKLNIASKLNFSMKPIDSSSPPSETINQIDSSNQNNSLSNTSNINNYTINVSNGGNVIFNIQK